MSGARLPFVWGLMAALALLLATQAPAHAQTSQPAPVPAVRMPACEAAPIGKGTYPKVVDTAAGTWAVWWCGDRFSWQPEFLVKSASYQLKTPTLEQLAGKTMAEVYRLIWSMNAGAFPNDPNLAILWTEARDWAEANKPDAPLWTVAPNGTAADRPAYTRTAAGARSVSAVPGLRAPINTECVCTEPALRVESAAGVYCPWLGATVEPGPQITLCRQVPRP
jgi:hypothetical protein